MQEAISPVLNVEIVCQGGLRAKGRTAVREKGSWKKVIAESAIQRG